MSLGGGVGGVVLKKPRRLKPGDRIVLASPSKAPEPAAVEKAACRLRALGYEVVVPDDLCLRRGYLAGSDRARAERLNAALLDEETACLLCMAGGYGAMRLLPFLDWDRLAARRIPPAIVGFSDITALHIALNRRLGWVTYHGPMGMTMWGGDEPPAPALAEQFWASLGALVPGGTSVFWPLPFMEHPVPVPLAPGVAEGRLCGGNLALVTALMGTPWEIDTRGTILFLEDVGEEPYRVDRMLCELALAGKLEVCAGILLGGWTHCHAETPNASLRLEEVFEDYFVGLGIPVLSGWPSGHLPNQLTLPLGVRVRIDTGAGPEGLLSLLETPWQEA